MMKKIIYLWLLCCYMIMFHSKSFCQLIISQYIETSSGTKPKGIELWNQSGSIIDFSVNNLVIKKGINGGTPSNDLTLSSGTLAVGAVIVIGSSDMQETAERNGATFQLKPFTFNGNDALEIWIGGTLQDMFGTSGSDPGNAWTGNGVSSANQNISIKSGITTGDTDGWTDPSTRFETTITDNSLTGFGLAPVAGTLTWDGSTNTDWNTPDNWDGGIVPTISYDVIIANVTNKPIISSAAECYNLTIDNSASLNINPNYSLTVNGNLTINGSLTINSDATGTGSLITLGTITGSATFERFTAQNTWWYTSLVVSGANSNIYTPETNDLWYYDEPGQAWAQISTTGTALTACQGYAFRNTSADETLKFTGNLLTGNQSIELTYNTGSFQGFNLVGNPYPSAIDWESGGITKTYIDNKLWYRTGGNFATWNSLSGGNNGGQQYVPAGQGFWVKANSAGPFEVSNKARVHNTTDFYKKDNNNPLLSLTAINDTYTDEAVLAFMDGSEPGFDAYDTEKMFATNNNYPQIWYQADDKLVAVNILPEIENTMAFPLGFRAMAVGEYTIYVTRFENIADSIEITLEDLITETIIKLNDSSSYTFNSEIVDNSDRFIVHIINTALTNSMLINENNIKIYAYHNKIIIQNAENANLEIYNISGKLVKKEMLSSSGFKQISLTNTTGYYFVKIITQTGIITQKIYINQ